MSKKVYIVGFAPSWAETPWQDDAEIWVLNEFYKVIEQNKVSGFKATRWFEIHDRNSKSKATPEHQAFLKQCPVPVYMQQKYEDIPNSIRFPKDEIMCWLEEKGYGGSGYFTNSISWMIALALYEGFEEIRVYGVDMSNNSEYGYQKPSCEYFIGLAEGLGVKFFIPEASELLKAGQLYGFESNNKLTVWIKTQREELKKRGKIYAQQEEQARNAMIQAMIAQAECRGASGAYDEVLKRRQ